MFGVDSLEAAKRWFTPNYPAFDWLQSILERYPIRPQTFILVVWQCERPP